MIPALKTKGFQAHLAKVELLTETVYPHVGFAALAQLVEHIIRNDGVRCSSHLSGTIFNQGHGMRILFFRVVGDLG
jgi:hypothetical protein